MRDDRWAYYITASEVDNFEVGNVIFLDFYAGKFMERYSVYDEEKKAFINPVRGILIKKVKNDEDEMKKVIKDIFFDEEVFE